MHSFSDFQAWFNPLLLTHTSTLLKRVADISAQHPVHGVFSAIPGLIQSGKRVRPYLCQLGYQALEDRSVTAITQPLIGLELFHLFCLIHDDVIDGADMRRGAPTVHQDVAKRFCASSVYGEHQAVLVGDLIHAWSMEALLSGVSVPAAAEVHRMIEEVVVGQMIDVHHTVTDPSSEEELLMKMRLKTASYTFTRPFRIGMALAGDHERMTGALDAWLTNLGVTFQMQDDYLDVFGRPEQTGKPYLNDLQEGQDTLVLRRVLDGLEASDRSEIEVLLGTTFSSEQTDRVSRILEASGLEQELRSSLQSDYTELLEQVGTFGLRSEIEGALDVLIRRLMQRTT